MQKHFPMLVFIVLAGYSCSVQASGTPVTISEDEALAFQRSLLSLSVPYKHPAPIFIQPTNKIEACKLPSTPDQMARTNFRAYWDGDCKNGFAYGLGRDIAISDTHHTEEITVHNGTGEVWSSQPSVYYDYVNKQIAYSVWGSTRSEMTSLTEYYNDTIRGLEVVQELTVLDISGQVFTTSSSPFNTYRIYASRRTDAPIEFRFSDTSAGPRVNPDAPIFKAEIFDTRNGTLGPYVIGRYPNGSEHHFRVLQGNVFQPVTLPASYTRDIQIKFQEILNATSQTKSMFEKPAMMEREYLFKACNGKSSIKGLDNTTYTKICNWRDQFKVAYAAASENFQKQLAIMHQQAATAGQQKQIQQQIALQQQVAIQQQSLQQGQNSQAAFDAGEQIVKSSADFLRGATQGFNSWQPPAVQPITYTQAGSSIIGSNRVTYRQVGSTLIGSDGTSCRIVGSTIICR